MPDVDLTDTQWRLLAQLVAAALPDPGIGWEHATDVTVRGLELEQVRADIPVLTWLKLLEQRDDWLAATALGAAAHYRRLYESAEVRLSEVARLAEAHEMMAPRLALAVRRLAQGSITFEEALSGAGRRPA